MTQSKYTHEILDALILGRDAQLFKIENYEAEYKMYPNGSIQQFDIDEAKDELGVIDKAIAKAEGNK